MAEEFFVRSFDNGLTLVAQRMGQVSSAAMTVALPAGTARDPEDKAGAASVASSWLLRGAGGRDTRQLHAALDSLGCQHHEDADSAHLLFSAAQLGRNLPEVIALTADILRRPHLGDESFGPCRDQVSQTLDGLEDEPAQKCSILIREKFYPFPLGRNPYGGKDSLGGLDAPSLREHLRRCLTPSGGIVAVAGRFDWPQLEETVGAHLGDWRGQAPPGVVTRPPAGGIAHISKETAQVQVALAYPAVTVSHDLYYPCRLAQMVLSGGMSSRLFTEVREKRGLVYAVFAQYHSLKDQAGMFAYAGTTPEKGQQTLEVVVGVLRSLSDGVRPEEVARARTQLKTTLVMQGESTSARAGALAGDFYHLGRLRSLPEIAAAVDAVTADDVTDFARAYPARPFTMLTIGPRELDAAPLA